MFWTLHIIFRAWSTQYKLQHHMWIIFSAVIKTNPMFVCRVKIYLLDSNLPHLPLTNSVRTRGRLLCLCLWVSHCSHNLRFSDQKHKLLNLPKLSRTLETFDFKLNSLREMGTRQDKYVESDTLKKQCHPSVSLIWLIADEHYSHVIQVWLEVVFRAIYLHYCSHTVDRTFGSNYLC